MKPRLLVLSDDITGATDVSAQLAETGVSHFTWVNPESLESAFFSSVSWARDYQAMCLNTESRHLSPQQAASRVTQALQNVGGSFSPTHYYKKVDSTLRGNVGAELVAYTQTLADSSCHFAVANPSMHRSVRQGLLWVGERMLHESEFARDPHHPMRESRVKRILANSLSPLQAGDSLEAILIHDSQTQLDLDRLAEKRLAACTTTFAGSAGFARALSRSLFAPSSVPIAPNLSSFGDQRGTVLVISGSQNPVSHRQIESIRSFPQRCVRSPQTSAQQKELWRTLLHTQGGLCLYLPQEPLPTQFPHRWVAEAAVDLLQSQKVDNLMIFGGDTAMAILTGMGMDSLSSLGEVVPGVAWMRPIGNSGEMYPFENLFTKPGGFGSEDTLQRILAMISGKAK